MFLRTYFCPILSGISKNYLECHKYLKAENTFSTKTGNVTSKAIGETLREIQGNL